MDKFGVLKVLSSLFDLYKQNSKGSSSKSSLPFDVENLLSPLKNLVGDKNNSSNQSAVPPTQTKPPVLAPLQNKMLSIMNSHDQIVERVKSNSNRSLHSKKL